MGLRFRTRFLRVCSVLGFGVFGFRVCGVLGVSVFFFRFRGGGGSRVEGFVLVGSEGAGVFFGFFLGLSPKPGPLNPGRRRAPFPGRLGCGLGRSPRKAL